MSPTSASSSEILREHAQSTAMHAVILNVGILVAGGLVYLTTGTGYWSPKACVVFPILILVALFQVGRHSIQFVVAAIKLRRFNSLLRFCLLLALGGITELTLLTAGSIFLANHIQSLQTEVLNSEIQQQMIEASDAAAEESNQVIVGKYRFQAQEFDPNEAFRNFSAGFK
jgi:hypothetical protein